MGKKYYDLSQTVYDGCPGWPTYEPTVVRKEASHAKDHFEAEQIRLNSHTGTHMDAPYHFYEEGITIDKIPVEQFCGRAVLVDLRDQIGAREGIEVSHLRPYEKQITEGDIVLLNTGWGKKRSFEEIYIHDWPYLTGDGAAYLADRKIKGIGIDCMSIGGWYEGTGRPCHEILLGQGIWIVEELNIPDELMKRDACEFMSFPIKFRGFSGAPARAVAATEE